MSGYWSGAPLRLLDALLGYCSGTCCLVLPDALVCQSGTAPGWKWVGESILLRRGEREYLLDPDADVFASTEPDLLLTTETESQSVHTRAVQVSPGVIALETRDTDGYCVGCLQIPVDADPGEWLLKHLDPSQQLACAVQALGPLLDGAHHRGQLAFPWYSRRGRPGTQEPATLADIAAGTGTPDGVHAVIEHASLGIAAERLQALVSSGEAGEASLVHRQGSEHRAAWLGCLAFLASSESAQTRSWGRLDAPLVRLTPEEERAFIVLALEGWFGTPEELVRTAQTLTAEPPFE